MSKEEKQILKNIGPYLIRKSLGKGGMGEVFLAFDPICKRNVALKCIRDNLNHKKAIQNRFLKEAKIASQLTHPSIIPIFAIHSETAPIYYTMPYVEGETLKEILKRTIEQEKKTDPAHPIRPSIPALCRIFLNVCEAIAYTHSKGFLHRDLKPDNIMIGKYGEVMILDWGIADTIESKTPPPSSPPDKIAGTVSYMAPERALGSPASVPTEIYALGVILYQILTLHLPFQRGTLAQFRKFMLKEKYIEPMEVAPYRDIPHQLSEVAKRCLAFSEADRYQTVNALLSDLKNYIEGKPEWILMRELSLDQKRDWEFQENVFLAKHTAIARHTEVNEWVSLMISKCSFSGNIRLEADICLKVEGKGIGFLLIIPEANQRKGLEDGYLVWISDSQIQLFRSNILVMEVDTPPMKKSEWHHICLEKVDEHLGISIDSKPELSFTSHLPLAGTHIGFLHKDAAFSLKNFKVFGSSHNVMVNCLAVPDTFFSHKDYDIALREYRRIGRSFPGRAEGRDALFRAGMTLLEKAKRSKKNKKELFYKALEEFEHLRVTAGGPFEYLGKSLVYEALGDMEDEAKCLELAIRKYPRHPLRSVLAEHIIYRMHESSRLDRKAAYRLILLAVRYMPRAFENQDTRLLLDSLRENWEPLSFIEDMNRSDLIHLSILLSFWLGKKHTLIEIIHQIVQSKPLDDTGLANALFCLLKLECHKELKDLLLILKDKLSEDLYLTLKWIATALASHFESINDSLETFFMSLQTKELSKRESRTLWHLLFQAQQQGKTLLVNKAFRTLKKFRVERQEKPYFDAMLIQNYLLENRPAAAQQIFEHYPIDQVRREEQPFFFLYGTYLSMEKRFEEVKKHFSQILDTPFPPTTALGAHFLSGKINERKGWVKKAFFWEKKKLYIQLAFHFRCLGMKAKESHFEKKSKVKIR